MPESFDVLVIGGGINGVGVARDAAGRGLSVLLVERDDFGAATSSASSKLIHGGLRYLEQREFKLVKEALREREILLNVAPHLVHPLLFVMPHSPKLRAGWMVKVGLSLYDRMAGDSRLPKSRSVDIRGEGFGAGIQASLRDGFAYWDARVDDSRLVLATARDAVRRGAQLRSRCEVLAAKRSTNWRVMLQDSARHRAAEVEAKLIVNTAGPWVNDVLEKRLSVEPKGKLRLVKGSHIVVPAQYPGEHAFILQNEDRRMVFMIPYLGAYTLIGTTDVPDDALDKPPRPHGHEVEYLFAAANMHLVRPIGLPNLVWLYSGLRPLFDDGSEDPSQVTRDYRIIADGEKGVAPVITVYGGKITTFRHLAEMVVNETATWFSGLKDGWTENALLPGGDLGGRKFAAFVAGAQAQFPKLPPAYLAALVSRHGADVGKIIGGVESETDLGQKFAENLYAREVDRMIEREWALTADDVLWRRSKAGIGLGAEQRDALDDYIKNKLPA